MPAAFSYRLYGLTLSSAIELPELIPAPRGEAPDVVIELGEVAMPDASDQTPQPIDGGSAIAVEGVARYAIRAGTRITVDPAAGAAARNVRLYLLGSAMGMLLHQRGLLPLHANAIEIDGRAFAFMGPSGAGKSTLAAWFHDRGFGAIADDVCVIGFGADGRPFVSPGLPRLRMWKDALEASGRAAASFQYSYAGDDSWEKYDVPLDPGAAGTADIPLAAIYLLEEAEQFDIAPLDGLAAADALFSNTYRGQYLAGPERRQEHMAACLRLLGQAMFRVRRRRDLTAFDQECRRILDHAQQVGRAQ